MNAGEQLSSMFPGRIDLSAVRDKVDLVKGEISKIIVGQEEVAELIITAILADGHILLEGVPGIAKTLIAKIAARTIDADFRRIQFTPDLMPSDILGTSVFNPKITDFEFRKGPIFSNIVLVDEVNRSPAKTQAALFEVMEEKQITMDGITYALGYPFLVIATQNPIEHEGTYRLPEAQIDRFLFKIDVRYPDLQEEISILDLKNRNENHPDLGVIRKVMDSESLRQMKHIVHQVHVEHKILEYIARIVIESRNNGSLYLGASPRASAALLASAKAYAAVKGRDFITPEDVSYLAYPVLRHRIILTSEREMEGSGPDQVITEILQKIEVPR